MISSSEEPNIFEGSGQDPAGYGSEHDADLIDTFLEKDPERALILIADLARKTARNASLDIKQIIQDAEAEGIHPEENGALNETLRQDCEREIQIFDKQVSDIIDSI